MILGIVASQGGAVPTSWVYTGTGFTYTTTNESVIYPDQVWPNECLTQVATVALLPDVSLYGIGDTCKVYGYYVDRFSNRSVCTVYLYEAQ